MTFTIPTTKTELFSTLKEIFNYYRIRRQAYEGITLNPLVLQRQSFTPLDDQQLNEKASLLLSYEQKKMTEEKKAELQSEQSRLEGEIIGEQTALSSGTETINSEYAVAKLLLEQEAKKKGISDSTILISKLAELESERVTKIANLTSLTNAKIASLNSQLSDVNTLLENIDEYYSELFEKQIESKARELKNEQEALVRDIFRYNNGLDEKEQRSENSVKQAQASLELRYAEINAVDLSHDQLVEMGYYKDVIDCVCGFYNTAFATVALAYQDMLNESKLVMYLDDYYSEVLYLYRAKLEA